MGKNWNAKMMMCWWHRVVFQFVLNQGLQTSCLICWTGTQASVVFLEIDQLNMWFKFRASWRFTNWANQNIVFSSCLSREKFYYIGCFVCFRFHGMWCLWTLLEHQTWSWHWWWGNTTLLMRWLRFYRQACLPLIQMFFGFASDIDQTNTYRDIRDGNWLSKILWHVRFMDIARAIYRAPYMTLVMRKKTTLLIGLFEIQLSKEKRRSVPVRNTCADCFPKVFVALKKQV